MGHVVLDSKHNWQRTCIASTDSGRDIKILPISYVHSTSNMLYLLELIALGFRLLVQPMADNVDQRNGRASETLFTWLQVNCGYWVIADHGGAVAIAISYGSPWTLYSRSLCASVFLSPCMCFPSFLRLPVYHVSERDSWCLKQISLGYHWGHAQTYYWQTLPWYSPLQELSFATWRCYDDERLDKLE